MKPIDRSEVLSLADYEQVRERFRARVLARKRARRVALGEHLGVVVENRDTVLLQIQEMLRTERITSEAGIAHEIATYNELVPGAGELSLTLFVEIPDPVPRERMLRELVGLERQVALEIDGERFPARAGERIGADRTDRTTAVHYLKVKLPPAVCDGLRGGRAGTAALRVDHPAYQARAELGAETVAELAADLGEPS